MSSDDADQQAVDEAEEDESGTASALFRWKWLSTVTTWFVLISWFTLVLTGALDNVGTEARWLIHLTYLMAVVYALGPGTLREIQEARQAGGAAE